MTAFELPATAQPGDRLPDTWLRFESGERVRLHKAFGGRPIWLAVAAAVEMLPPTPEEVTALAVDATYPLPTGWQAVAVDPAWRALLEPGVLQLDTNFRVVAPGSDTPDGLSDAALDEDSSRRFAPVLQVPRVLEPALCLALMEHLETVCNGGEPSRVLVLARDESSLQLAPDIKMRRESPILDSELEAAVHARLNRRVLPEIARAFQFDVSRRDPFKLLAYDPASGFFSAHRDNDTRDVAYRRFAVSVNLNCGAYDGGSFRFPEFGARPYAPETGSALVFSCSLLHEVSRVERGTRYALTTFLA